MQISMEDIECFLLVAEQGSFTKASEIMFQTQPTVSRKIAHLEHEFGTKLLEREGKTVSLTPEGVLAYSRLLDVKRNLINLRGVISKEGRQKGRLRLACNGVYDIRIMTDISQRIKEQYPGIELKFVSMGAEKALKELTNGHLDAVMTIKCEVDGRTDIEYEKLMKQRMSIVLPTGHRLAGKEKISMKELENERFVLWARDAAPVVHDHFEKACSRAGFMPRINNIFSDYARLKFDVIASGCITFLAEQCWREEERIGTKVYAEEFAPDVDCVIAKRSKDNSPELLCLWKVAIEMRDEGIRGPDAIRNLHNKDT